MTTEAETVETARRPGIAFIRRQMGVDLSKHVQGMSEGSGLAVKGLGAFIVGALATSAAVVPAVALAGTVLEVAGTLATLAGTGWMAYKALRAKRVVREFREQDAAQGPAAAFLKTATGMELSEHLQKVNKLSMAAYMTTAVVVSGAVLSGPGALVLAGIGVAAAKIFSNAVRAPAAAASQIIEANAGDASAAAAPAKAPPAHRIVAGA